jgi:Fe-S cluster assembly protein SufD
MSGIPQNELTEIRTAWQAREPDTSSWLGQLQEQALDAFERNGFPSKRMEDWKYTNMQPVAENYPGWLSTESATDADTADLLDIPDAVHLAFIDGQYQPQLSGSTELPAGVLAGNLATLTAEQPDAIHKLLGRLANNDDSGFIALNTAFATDAVVLLIPDNVVLERPVYISFFSGTPHVTVQPRLLIDLGVNSQATVIEHYTSSTPAIVNTVTEIFANQGSSLTWYKLQDEHTETSHTGAQYAELAQDASIQTTQLDIGGKLVRNQLHLKLAGRGADANAKGLFMADDKRHVDSRITVEHAAPDTTSQEQFRGVLGGQACGVFNGRILVQQEAQKTAAALNNRNLLLSPQAEINTKPELEIYADDVKCAHGSTTGQLDATALFYLLSRGIDPTEARKILIKAFVGELLTGIAFEALSNRVQTALQQLEADDERG